MTEGATAGTSPMPFPGLIGYGSDNTDGPKAYLNVLVFDQNYHLLSSTFEPVTSAAEEDGTDVAHEYLSIAPITIEKPGYVYIYTSNENPTPVEVFFDDFAVTQTNTPIVQKDDYYPFGGQFASYTKPGTVDQNFKYNGKEEINDLGFDMLDYGWRMYQSDLGRWFNPDPLADSNWMYSPYNYVENNPLIYIDPDGLDNYYIYGDGSMYMIKNDDKSNSYTYFSNDGNTHDIGTFGKNDKGLVSLGNGFSYNKDGVSIGYTVKSGTAKKGSNYVSGDAMASFIGALADNNTTDAYVTNASNSDGTSPSPSKSHVEGKALDLRYLRRDKSGSAVNIWSNDLDVSRQNAFNQSLSKFGYTKLLSEHHSTHNVTGAPPNHPEYMPVTINHRLNYTTHYARGKTRHYHHLHAGGKWAGKIQYAPKLKVIKP